MASKKACKDRKVLRTRTPEEWVRLIMALPERPRNAVARVVWYDYFADREVPDRWPHLDWYLDTVDEPPSQEFVDGLIAVGYPLDVAIKRASWRPGEYFGPSPDPDGFKGVERNPRGGKWNGQREFKVLEKDQWDGGDGGQQRTKALGTGGRGGLGSLLA